MMYKVVHNLVHLPVYYMTPIVSVRGHSQRFLVPFARTLVYLNSNFPDTIRWWNSLSQPVISCTTVDSFKREVEYVSYARLVLSVLKCTVNRDTSRLSAYQLSCTTHVPVRVYAKSTVSVLQWKRKKRFVTQSKNKSERLGTSISLAPSGSFS